MKQCNNCGRQHDHWSWRALAFIGIQHFDYDDGDTDDFEMRNCPCGSTLTKDIKANGKKKGNTNSD